MKSILRHAVLACTLLLFVAGTMAGCKNNKEAAAAQTDSVVLTPVQFSADSAMAYVNAQCAFGARVPNSEAHRKCGSYIAAKFAAFGLKVTEQRATFTGWDGKRLEGCNIIASYRPDLAERVVIAAHWDSRPWADADPDTANHRKPVMAANDGASGVAVMLEIARQLDKLKPAVGIDFVCFDMEDYGAPYWGTAPADGSDWCLGSQYWAQQAAAKSYRARYGILLDMVGGRDARFCLEGYSKQNAEAVMNRLWDTAESVGAGSLFVKTDGSWCTDDHVPMNQIAGIPTVDVIPYVEGEHSFGETWHTVNDTPENISPETLRLVGQTLLQMLSEEE